MAKPEIKRPKPKKSRNREREFIRLLRSTVRLSMLATWYVVRPNLARVGEISTSSAFRRIVGHDF
jgi:hypothetical protein